MIYVAEVNGCLDIGIVIVICKVQKPGGVVSRSFVFFGYDDIPVFMLLIVILQEFISILEELTQQKLIKVKKLQR